jgi:hypothetical protein
VLTDARRKAARARRASLESVWGDVLAEQAEAARPAPSPPAPLTLEEVRQAGLDSLELDRRRTIRKRIRYGKDGRPVEIITEELPARQPQPPLDML